MFSILHRFLLVSSIVSIKNNKSREHIIRQPIKDVLANGIEKGLSNEQILDGIMRTLDQQKMISYCSKDELSVLTPAGRVLVSIMEDQTMTQRALSVYLGVTESSVQKSIKQLVDAGLLIKKKTKGRNQYFVNKEVAFKHPDVARFYDSISKLTAYHEPDEESPF